MRALDVRMSPPTQQTSGYEGQALPDNWECVCCRVTKSAFSEWKLVAGLS